MIIISFHSLCENKLLKSHFCLKHELKRKKMESERQWAPYIKGTKFVHFDPEKNSKYWKFSFAFLKDASLDFKNFVKTAIHFSVEKMKNEHIFSCIFLSIFCNLSRDKTYIEVTMCFVELTCLPFHIYRPVELDIFCLLAKTFLLEPILKRTFLFFN